MFDNLYSTVNMKEAFGSSFVGPDKLIHGEEALVAKVESAGGRDVEVYCTFMPAKFFRLVDSEGFQLSTGSCTIDEALDLATMISEDMLVMERAE
jgi:hypothetical protein